NFQVKNTFSGTGLGLPAPLGGLMFSSDGTVLYVVGGSETTASALYAVPGPRDPGTRSVTTLGPAGGGPHGLGRSAAAARSGAGLEVGPAGTLFYTYWSANYLGERPEDRRRGDTVQHGDRRRAVVHRRAHLLSPSGRPGDGFRPHADQLVAGREPLRGPAHGR